jgi:1-acyl-sn-glycerol-3-phosphate acyltransferase
MSAPPTADRVLGVTRELAREVGGDRAASAVSLDASLERDVGFGSLERSELLARLEREFGRPLDDSCLSADRPRELAAALADASPDADPDAVGTETGVPEAAPASAAGTLHQSLWERADRDPGRPHTFLREEDGSEHTISYGRLRTEAAAVAGALRDRGVRRGDRVALMLPTGLDFLRSFQGILLARAIPVPIYPPLRLDRMQEYAERQAAILSDAGVTLLITVRRAVGIARLLQPRVKSLAQVTTAEDLASAGASWGAPDGSPDDPAFIQYTSGSTGAPKGVLLTHANLLANIRAIAAGLAVRPNDVGACWLPLYHDMGLIGSWLFCMHQGLPIAILSPLAFLARPERWLWTVHRRRVTLSAAPNFAFELCVRRVSEAAAEGLDLSSWRCLLNGAEPVNPDTLERFAARFAPHGFRREALMPVYGLAESSVAVCFPPPGRGPRVDRIRREPFAEAGRAEPAPAGDGSALRFVSVGCALPEHEVRLVDAGGRDVGERQVGRLVFRGPSMTAGYYGKPEATAAVRFEEDWLDSGDLAYRADGETYVTGRRKDLIIKSGRNLVPQELEEIAGGVPGVRRGCVAAFGVPQPEQGTETVVILAETRAKDAARRAEIAALVRQRVADSIGLPPDVVELVPPGSVPKTSSGKIRRADAKRLYASGALGAPSGSAWIVWARLAAATAGAELARAARSVARALYGVYLASVLAPLALAGWALAALAPGRDRVRLAGRAVARTALSLGGCRLRVSGGESLSGLGPVLLASNHTSFLDIPVLLALLPRSVTFLAKREVLRWPVVGAFVRRGGHLTVDRREVQRSLEDAEAVTRAIRAGESILVFPEATFTAAAGLRPFRLGVFRSAVETGRPVVPLALRGARRVLRDGRWLPRPGPIDLWIGDPILPDGADWDAQLRLRDRVAQAIAEHCGEPRLDMVAGGYVRDSPGDA